MYDITFTRKNNPLLFHYTLGGKTIEWVNKIRDLGVILYSKLQFNDHIDL